MDAKELTKVVDKNKERIFFLEKHVEQLTQKVEKMELLLNDLRIDVKMMEGRK